MKRIGLILAALLSGAVLLAGAARADACQQRTSSASATKLQPFEGKAADCACQRNGETCAEKSKCGCGCKAKKNLLGASAGFFI